MTGWVRIHRTLADHELWLYEMFTYGQAFLDLIILANHKPGSIIVRGIQVFLERGQVGWSELSLAKRWRWSRGKVRRYLGMIRERGMVEVKQDNKTTIITIVNYNTYQNEDVSNGTPNRTADGTPCGTPNGQQTDTNNNGKNEEKKKPPKSPFVGLGDGKDSQPVLVQPEPPKKKRPPKQPAPYSEAFEAFWETYPRKTAKGYAWECWQKVGQLKLAKVPQIMAALKSQIAAGVFERELDKIPHASTWLNQRRWEDGIPGGGGNGNGSGPQITKEQRHALMRQEWDKLPDALRRQVAKDFVEVLNDAERGKFLQYN